MKRSFWLQNGERIEAWDIGRGKMWNLETGREPLGGCCIFRVREGVGLGWAVVAEEERRGQLKH